MTTYEHAAPVEAIAGQAIRDVPDHARLGDVRVTAVFKEKASKSHGRLVLGTTKLVTGLNAWLANDGDPFFVLEVAEDTWVKLTDPQKKALVDHLLCRCTVDHDDDGAPVLALRAPDVSEFAAIIDRHGFWKSDVAKFGSAIAEQLSLAIDDAARFDDNLG
jgi:hypothetical protein